MSEGASQSRPRSLQEPDEHSTLLQYDSHVNNNDPENDEGAIERVNPLNQRNARIYRAVLIGLFALAVFWLALLSVDQLISVGIGATQGSGFENFAVSLLAVAIIGATLVFYRAPSPSDRTLNILCAVLIFIDMIVIVTVEQLRRRIGPIPMLLSFGGAAVACLLGSVSDIIVQRAKEEEQERVLGHSSTRRSATEWIGVVVGNVFRIVFLVLMLLVTINLIFDAADSHVSVGSLIRVGDLPDGNGNDGTVIHLACSPAGTDGPVAIIEAGETSGEDMHGWVQRARGLKAVCFWDRPGIGLSDNAASPLGIEMTVSFLLAALEQERPDFRDEKLVLISHGVGALYSRVFANMVADQLGGIMMVDGQHEEYFYSEQTAAHGLREFIRGLTATVTLKKITGVVRGMNAEERLFGLLAYTSPRLHKALLQQQVSANRRTAVDISIATSSLPGDVPILVVSSSESCQNQLWNRYQRLLLKLSDRVVAWKILDGPHNLWWNKRAEKELIAQLESFVSYIMHQ